MAVTTFDREYKKAFCVDEIFFTRVERLAADPKGGLQVKIWLSDSSRIDNLTVADLNAFPNLSSRKIIRVDLETPRAAGTTLQLTMRQDYFVAPASYQIVGDDKDAAYLSSELDKLLRDSFVWYSRLLMSGAWAFTILFVTVLAFTITPMAWFGMNDAGKVVFPANIYASLVAAVVGLAGIILLALHKRIFPVGTFRIGDGVIRANKSAFLRQTIASVVFGGVILGLLVHVFGSRIYDVLFGH